MSRWKSRIVGEGEERVKDLAKRAHPLNWRKHPGLQAEALEKVLDRVGWVQRVIVNRRTGRLLDGHLRVELAKRRGEESVPVLYVDLDEEEERLILATLDPLSALAEAEVEALREVLEGIELEDALVDALAEAVPELAEEPVSEAQDEKYTSLGEGPIYEPSGEAPPLGELYDDSKTQELHERIQAADVPEEVRPLLEAAAHRFTRFRFDRLADYYPHAPEEVKRLMEELALVIVDYDRAIELGFVKLSERLMELFREAKGD